MAETSNLQLQSGELVELSAEDNTVTIKIKKEELNESLFNSSDNPLITYGTNTPVNGVTKGKIYIQI